jgi:hypothetical protein
VGQPASEVRPRDIPRGRCDESDDHLAEARETAQRIGTDRDDYRLYFVPTNVDIWSVSLAVEMCDGTEAFRRAKGVLFPTGSPRERVGHHYIDGGSRRKT